VFARNVAPKADEFTFDEISGFALRPAKRKVVNYQIKIAGARSENTLISVGAGRSLINKTSRRKHFAILNK
jgi:hypothetical protein